jgi:antirestriction protein ArdC
VLPFKTVFHEVAHVILGHTTESLALAADSETTPQTLQETEAESVAYLCCQTLGLGGAAESRGYVQSWLGQHGSEGIPEKSAAKIMSAAEKILAAGSDKPAKAEA